MIGWLPLLLAALLVLAIGGALDTCEEADAQQTHRSSWYGYNAHYDWSGSVTATGEPFNPWRVDAAATAIRPDGGLLYPLGTRLLVCDATRDDTPVATHGHLVGCVTVVTNDSCPGCWERGFSLDLTAGAWRHMMGKLEWTVAQVEIWRVP